MKKKGSKMRDVTKIAQEEGIRNPVFIFQGLYETYIRQNGNREVTEARLRGFLSVLRFEMEQANGNTKNRGLSFEFDTPKTQNHNQRRAVLEIITGRWDSVTHLPRVFVFWVKRKGHERKALPTKEGIWI